MNKLIEKRKSTVAFADRPVEEEKLQMIFKAAQWAPSSFNEQPWRYIYATNEDPVAFEKLANCLYEGNSWAKNAPVLILALTKKTFSHNGKSNKHAWHDLGLSVGNLSIQATDLGLHLHPMGGFDAEIARTTYGIPDEYDTVTMIALGYRGDINELDENLKKRESNTRTRKPLEQLVFNGEWK